jgi:hypothetical protein
MTDVANIWSNFGYGNSANFRDFQINQVNEFASSSSSSSSTSVEGGETDTNNQNCGNNGTSGCDNVCPASCFANAFMQNTESAYDSELITATNTGTGSNSPACQSVAQQNAGLTISEKYFGSTTVKIVTTRIPQTNMTIPSPLDTQLNEMITLYFEENTGYPTEYAIKTFNEIVQGATPIDLLHKNKLRDLIYYFMENIIPGLPTNARPVSYVEWIPIRWLSHSSI